MRLANRKYKPKQALPKLIIKSLRPDLALGSTFGSLGTLKFSLLLEEAANEAFEK